ALEVRDAGAVERDGAQRERLTGGAGGAGGPGGGAARQRERDEEKARGERRARGDRAAVASGVVMVRGSHPLAAGARGPRKTGGSDAGVFRRFRTKQTRGPGPGTGSVGGVVYSQASLSRRTR